ncbi:MAG: type I methionyl aminopeptidase [Rhodothermales bacterium]
MIHLKSQREIDHLRASADLVGRTLAEVARHIRPGVTTAKLDQVAEAFIRSHGAEPAFKGYQVGQLDPFPGTLCTSVGDVIVHGIPGDHVLQDGDLVSVDCGVLLNGYYGDSAFTFAVGEISDETAQLCRTTYESLHQGIEKAVHGNRIGDISHAVQVHCEAQGYGVVRDLVGHGIGRELHEKPQVPNFGRRGSGRKLKEGMTLCIEPMINRGTYRIRVDADGWTIRTADGLPSAHYEHMIVVRRGQAEVLSTFAWIEEVIDAPYHKEALTNG